MDESFKITIPKPCHEDWEKMTPENTGKFCTSCTKSVVDFTQMSSLEIQNYFILHQGKSVCGRFKTKQLDNITIEIPKTLLFTQVHFHKIFVLALFISMGTSLFSCSNTNGDKQKIDSVKVVDENDFENRVTVGMLLPNKHTSDITAVVPPPPPKNNRIHFVRPIITSGEVEIKPTKDTTNNEEITTGKALIIKDSVPNQKR